MNPWKSTEIAPKKSGNYFIRYIEDDEVKFTICKYLDNNSGGFWFWDLNSDCDWDEITHWMEIPKI